MLGKMLTRAVPSCWQVITYFVQCMFFFCLDELVAKETRTIREHDG